MAWNVAKGHFDFATLLQSQSLQQADLFLVGELKLQTVIVLCDRVVK